MYIIIDTIPDYTDFGWIIVMLQQMVTYTEYETGMTKSMEFAIPSTRSN